MSPRGGANGRKAAPVTALVVGDEPWAATVASSLEGTDAGLEPVVATTTEVAVDRTANDEIDCVVSSSSTPEPWPDLLERVRASAPELPFVLLVDDDEAAAAAVEAGVTDVFESAFEDRNWRATLLARRVRGHAGRYRSERQRGDSWDESRFRAIFEHSPNMISIHDQEGVIHNVNRRTCEKLGSDREELIGTNVREIEVGIEPEALEERWQSYEFGEPVTVEGRNRRTDGTEFPVRVSLGRIPFDDDALILAILRDVSEEKARERELERYERFVENAPIGIYRLGLGPDGRFEYVNPAMVSMFGADSRDHLAQFSLEQLCLEPDVDERLHSRLLDGDERIVSGEFELQRVDGTPIWGAVTAIRSEEEGAVYVDGVVEDVTERRRAEENRAASEAHLRQAQAVADFGSWHADVLTGELEWSDEVYDIFDVPRGERPVANERFFEYVHPDDRAAVERAWADAVAGEPYDVEHRILVDGETRWVREKAELAFDDDGRPTDGVGIVQDVTEQKAYERRLETQNEQLEVLNRIARHDIRNQMNVVEGYASELAAHLESDRSRMAERIADAARELLSIGRKIHQVNRLITAETADRPVDLSRLVDEVLADARRRYPSSECLATVPDSLWVRGTDGLRFALENVVENALEHNDSLAPRVEVTAARTDDGAIALRVEDNGPGLPTDEYEFLTGTRESTQVEHTSGLGLWAVNWIVTDVGGALRFDVDDGGTTVVLCLPDASPDDRSRLPWDQRSR